MPRRHHRGPGPVNALLGRLPRAPYRSGRRAVWGEHGEHPFRVVPHHAQAGAQEGFHLPSALVEGVSGSGAFVGVGADAQRLEPVVVAHGKNLRIMACHLSTKGVPYR